MRTVAAPRPDAPPVTSALEPLIFMVSPLYYQNLFGRELTRINANEHEFLTKLLFALIRVLRVYSWLNVFHVA